MYYAEHEYYSRNSARAFKMKGIDLPLTKLTVQQK